MALKLRRGTDLERQSVIFEEGELIYTTDTKTLWVGDGQTLGGIKVSGEVTESPISLTRNLDLNGFDITGGGDIDISGVVVSSGFYGDGSGLTNLPGQSSIVEGQEYQIDVRGNVIGLSSTLLIDAFTETISAAALNGHAYIDVSGSLFSGDSTLIVDGMNGIIYPSEIGGTNIKVNSDLTMVGDSVKNTIDFELKNLSVDLSTSNSDRGGIFFSRNDINGKAYESVVGGGRGGLYFIVYPDDGSAPEQNILLLTKEGNLGLGTYSPQKKLDVRGDMAASGSVQFGRLSDSERDALTSENGMVIYNTTVNRFQGYQNNSWINLDDGSAV